MSVRTLRRAVSILVLLWCGGTAVEGAVVHEGLHEKIAKVSRAIEESPDDSALYLLRSDYLRRHRAWRDAEADLRRALALDPELERVHLAAARLYRDRGWTEAALLRIDTYLEEVPRDGTGHLVRAEILARRGERTAAIRAYTTAIGLLDPPRPDHYLARSRLRARDDVKDMTRALHGLDAGIARLGPVPSLVFEAVEIEVDLGRFESALTRLRAQEATTPRREALVARRGDVLLRAGRRGEARAAYREAKDLVLALPPRARHTQTTIELAAELDRLLEALAAGQDASPSPRSQPPSPPYERSPRSAAGGHPADRSE